MSRVLGFIRDAIIARYLVPASQPMPFFTAFKLPNLRRIFAEAHSRRHLCRFWPEYKNQRGEQETRLLLDHVSGVLALALAIVTASASSPHRGSFTPRPRLCRQRGKIRPDGYNCCITFSLYPVHFRWHRWPGRYSIPITSFDSGVSRQRCSTSRSLPVRCCSPLLPPAGTGAGLGGIHRRHIAAGLPTALSGKNRHAAAPQLDWRDPACVAS